MYASTSIIFPELVCGISSQVPLFRGYCTSTRSTSNPTGSVAIIRGSYIFPCFEELKTTSYINSSQSSGYLSEVGSLPGCCVKLNCISSSTSFRSEEHTSELQSRGHLVCRLLLAQTKRPAERTRSESSGARSDRVCSDNSDGRWGGGSPSLAVCCSNLLTGVRWAGMRRGKHIAML